MKSKKRLKKLEKKLSKVIALLYESYADVADDSPPAGPAPGHDQKILPKVPEVQADPILRYIQ